MPHTVVIDDGKHDRFVHWPRIKQMSNTSVIDEYIGDSHTISCLDHMKKWQGLFDFIFIDGDHSYEGVKTDIKLAKILAAPNALLAFHDTTQVPGVWQAYKEALDNGTMKELYRNNIRYGMAITRLT